MSDSLGPPKNRSGVGHQNCRVDNYSLSEEQYRVPKLKRMRINRTQWGNEFSH